VAQVHYRLATVVGIDLLDAGVDGLPRQERWDAMARAALRDELVATHAELTAAVLAGADPEASSDEVVAGWLASEASRGVRAATIRQVADGPADVARMNVGLGQLRSLLG
jgi:glutamate dehydrogenase